MSIEEDGMLDFVIRTKNERQYVSKSIDSVRRYFGVNSKIIIVDNCSLDDTIKEIESKKDKNIEILKIQDYSPGKAINMGLRECGTQIVGILSAHCEIIKFDFESLKCFDDENCFGLIGEQIPFNNGAIDYSLNVWKNFARIGVHRNILDLNASNYFFHNAFSFVSRKIWSQDNFDEKCLSKEDAFWAEKNIEKSRYFLFDSRIKANHFFTPNGATWRNLKKEQNVCI